MSSDAIIGKMECRENNRNLWHTGLKHTMQADLAYCCLSLWCVPSVSSLLRKRALYDDMNRYVGRAGYMLCSSRCAERNCPEFCLSIKSRPFSVSLLTAGYDEIGPSLKNKLYQKTMSVLSFEAVEIDNTRCIECQSDPCKCTFVKRIELQVAGFRKENKKAQIEEYLVSI